MRDMLESRVGLVLTSMYAIVSIAVGLYSILCRWENCNLFIVVPIMPWAGILRSQMGLSFPFVVYPLFVLLNAAILYVCGAGLESVYRRSRQFYSKDRISHHTASDDYMP